MLLYHGSTEIIRKPRLLEVQRLLDFGKGFYTTKNKNQAERRAKIKQKRNSTTNQPFVSVYQFSIPKRCKLTIKEFTSANEEWLDFIVKNRSEDYSHGYHIVIGPVANDTLYQTLSLYEAGILTKPETISRLKIHPLYNQVSFHSETAIELLQYQESYEVPDAQGD